MWFSRTSGTWKKAMVADRPVRCFEPSINKHAFALLYLHDQDGVALDELPIARKLIEHWGCRVICPHGGPGWWLPTMGNSPGAADWVNGPVLEWVHSEWNIRPPRLALLGLGMGGQGALRWGFADSARFPVVVSLQASIAFEQLHGQGTILDQLFASPEQCRQQTAGMLINPRQAPPSLALIAHRQDSLWYRGNDRLHEKLRALGVEHHADMTGDGSEAWWLQQWQFTLQFIETGMQASAKRLL